MGQFTWANLRRAWRQHWPYYLIEVLGIGAFVVFSSAADVFFNHPAAPGRQWLGDHELLRRAGVGLVVALVILGVSYSSWGKRSGTHINPAVTLSFWQLGSISNLDALGYILAQFTGALAAGALMAWLLHPWYSYPAVHYNLTKPGPGGWPVALVAEAGITGFMMLVLLVTLHMQRLKKLTPPLLAGLLAVYIILETPLSGMSLNPARSLGTAAAVGRYPALWVYFVGPLAASWLTAVAFSCFFKGTSLAAALRRPTEGPRPDPQPGAAPPPHFPDPTDDL